MVDVFEVRRGGFRNRKGVRKSDQDKVLSPEEFKALLDAARADRRIYGTIAYGMFFFAGNFGLRSGEAIDLRRDDFKTIRYGYFRVRTLKKKAQVEDRVYVGQKGMDVTQKVVDMRPVARGTDRLYPFTTRTARHFFAYYADKAGLSPNVSFHSLRHCAAHRMFDATKDLRLVNAFLRHERGGMMGVFGSTPIYTAPSQKELMDAMDKTGIIV